ncbi:unnamed protein product [Caenorhabditis auriculariae]|uniref:Large ribosomal subunit protein uL15m n=1 Tax=Caenorhabditis auriculariae TaxID=2777116 RepID=A0A8S1GP49_9PELO|nr:unnamed protein product [Caenorhabditis auriculariae]
MRYLITFLLLISPTLAQDNDVRGLCKNPPAHTQTITSKISIPAPYKTSGSVTNWVQSSTILLTETTTATYRVLSLKSKSEDRWITNVASNLTNYINTNNRSCVGEAKPPQLIENPRFLTLLHGDTSSSSSLVTGLIALSNEHPGFLKGGEPEVVGGMETVTWISCIDGINETSVAVEVRFTGEKTVHPARKSFDNPMFVSVRLTEYKSFNGTEDAVSQISVELDRYDLPEGGEDFVDHGIVCLPRNTTALPMKAFDEFTGVLSYGDGQGNREVFEILYSTSKKVLIISGDGSNKKISFINATGLPTGINYLIHDFAHGYEFLLSENTCVKISPLLNTTTDVVVNNGTVTMKQFARIIADNNLEFAPYPTDSSADKGTKIYRALNDIDKTVIEAELDGEFNLVAMRTYKQGSSDLVSTLKIAESHSSSLTRRFDHIVDCFQPDSITLNKTWTMDVKDKTMKDVYGVGLDTMTAAISSSLNTVGVINSNRISAFWTESSKEGVTLLLRVNEKSEIPPAAVGFDYEKELETKDFFDKLNATIASNQWKIKIPKAGEKIEEWTVDASSVSSFPQKQQSTFVGYTGGSMFVLGIFTLILGVCIGAGGVFFVVKKQRISTLAYQMAQRAVTSAKERALRIVEEASRLRLQDVRDNVGARTSGRQVRKANNQAGHTQGALERAAKPPLGWIWGDFFRPWQRMFPGERSFNADINIRREYIPLSLIELARLIDLGWISKKRPIDISALCATQKFSVNPRIRQYGFDLTAEGADDFPYAVDIEVQYASQSAIAAVERAGGRVRTAYYDTLALEAAVDPRSWFQKGLPVPVRRAPPPSLLPYYSDPSNRGYLCNVEDLEAARKKLADLRGYLFTETSVPQEEKEVNQVFYGIPAGAVVSLADKKVFAATNSHHSAYYNSQRLSDKSFT